MKHFTSTARKDGRWWVVQCDQEPGALSQVARLDQAGDHQREAISFVTDIDESDIDKSDIEVTVHAVIDNAVSQTLEQARAQRRESDELAKTASEGFRAAARELAGSGYSMRDVREILGVSFQRASQLVNH